MRSAKIFIALCVLLLAGACATVPQVFTDFDSSNSFNGYKTFAWAHTPPLVVAGSFPVPEAVQQKATSAIKAQLEAKGFKYVESVDKANFLVVYTLGARDDIQVFQKGASIYNNKENWLWGKKYHSSYFDMVLDEEFREQYTKGVIAIDIFDAKSQAPVWHAKASKSLSETELNSNGGDVEKAVAAVLRDFPPILKR